MIDFSEAITFVPKAAIKTLKECAEQISLGKNFEYKSIDVKAATKYSGFFGANFATVRFFVRSNATDKSRAKKMGSYPAVFKCNVPNKYDRCSVMYRIFVGIMNPQKELQI
ncbi:hypothetical protein D5R81_01020 [Parashewanella spongiae]|uniref:Uncharacterized protein n=1 Tax=Parashewanella spongiae TaxID=342950 RepID=A0A3A6U1V2_9GAMM|nr:hypothetical protein [Parashewanella spongiae]MCL1078399.1 hypothetical protein [Parashewanella spongiae]RJY19430.1 hypothetical protein D5R81_01020 [Parashewanella spongiae]